MDNPNRPEVVEAVAQAIWRVTEGLDLWPWDTLREFEREPFRRQAVAAIEAHTAALGLTEERLPVHPRTNAKPCDNCGHLKGVHAEPCRISDHFLQGRPCGCPEYRYTPPTQSWKHRFVTRWVAVPDSGGEQ